jgi:hypothetical protein
VVVPQEALVSTTEMAFKAPMERLAFWVCSQVSRVVAVAHLPVLRAHLQARTPRVVVVMVGSQVGLVALAATVFPSVALLRWLVIEAVMAPTVFWS